MVIGLVLKTIFHGFESHFFLVLFFECFSQSGVKVTFLPWEQKIVGSSPASGSVCFL